MTKKQKNKITGALTLAIAIFVGSATYAKEQASPANTVMRFSDAATKGDVKVLTGCCTGKMLTIIQRFIKAKQIKNFADYNIVNTVIGNNKFEGKAIVNCDKKQVNSSSNVKISLLLLKKNDNWLIAEEKFNRHYQKFEEYSPSPNIALFKKLSIELFYYAHSHDGSYPEKLEDIKSKFASNAKLTWIDPESQKELPLQYYTGYNEDKDYSKVLVAAPKPCNGKRRCIIVGKLRPKLIQEKEFQELLKKSK